MKRTNQFLVRISVLALAWMALGQASRAQGVTQTVAGGGIGGFCGDGSRAAFACLNHAFAVAFDREGFRYIADLSNYRVRRITPGGIISTFAGNGVRAFTGDNIPATQGSIGEPCGLFAEPTGETLLIADCFTQRIRKVSSDGAITTVAGNGLAGFSGDGGSATAARLFLNSTFPSGIAVFANNLYITDTINNRIRRVDANGTITTVAGGGTGGDNVLALLAQLSLPAGPVVFDANGNFYFAEAGGHRIRKVTTNGIITTVAGTGTAGFSGDGGGTLAWTATAVALQAAVNAPSWMSLSASAGSGTSSVVVTANTAGLNPGLYQGLIVVRSATGQTQRVPVSLQVNPAGPVLRTSQAGLIFTAVEGSATLPTRNFAVLNVGQGSLSWSAEIRSITGGNWLTLSPTSGTSEAGPPPPSVILTANATGLSAGSYTAVLRISAFGAANSPQLVSVALVVLPPGTTPPPQPTPSGLLFVGNAGGSAPATQRINVFAGSSTAVSFTASTTELDDDGWISVNPTAATASTTSPAALTVSVDPSALSAGVYRGFVNVSLSDGSTRSVNILLVAAPPGTVAVADETSRANAVTSPAVGGADQQVLLSLDEFPDAGAAQSPLDSWPVSAADPCTPSRLAVVHSALVSNFSSPVGFPIPLVVRVSDDCGTPITNASVVTTFSNGDRAIAMTNLRNGQYTGTWTPGTAASQVTIISTAVVPGLQEASAQITGAAGANAVAQVFSGGAVHAASFASGQPLAPGSIFSVFGTNLTIAQFFASTIPLPTELGNVSATLGDLNVPLYFSGSGQVNAQVPFELPAGSTAPLVLKAGNAFTVPETIHLTVAQPGIFTRNNSGTGPGAILDARSNLVSADNPVKTGDIIAIFAAGLGPTNPAVASGAASPSSPVAVVTRTATATVDGINAPVHFAGLAPTFVGLYQVNVEIPAGVRNGEVPVVISQEGVDSNTATIFVQN